MSQLFNEFSKVNLSQWKDKLISDLKGKPESILEITTNRGISLASYQSKESVNDYNTIPKINLTLMALKQSQIIGLMGLLLSFQMKRKLMRKL